MSAPTQHTPSTTELIAKLARKERLSAAKKPLSPWKAFCLWLIVAIASCVLTLSVLGLRSDLSQKIFEPIFLAEVLPMLLLSLVSAWGAIRLGSPESNTSSAKLASLFLLCGLLLLAFSFFSEFLHKSPEQVFRVYLSTGLNCAAGILGTGLAPTLLLLWVLKRGAVVRPELATVMLMLSGVSLGALAVNLYCSIDQALHHFLWTLGPSALFLVIGTWLLWRRVKL